MDTLKKFNAYIIYGVAGALGGLFYWNYVGCLDGDCIIASSAFLSSMYGMGIGLFATNSLKD
ncbi:MAG: hypothetical protein HRT72_12890, partial [Flavobacteriales bacterium]|nr:hypothetical protein [Flavobacteriales bacterium]